MDIFFNYFFFHPEIFWAILGLIAIISLVCGPKELQESYQVAKKEENVTQKTLRRESYECWGSE